MSEHDAEIERLREALAEAEWMAQSTMRTLDDLLDRMEPLVRAHYSGADVDEHMDEVAARWSELRDEADPPERDL